MQSKSEYLKTLREKAAASVKPNNKREEDPTVWLPSKDTNGESRNLLRFLPAYPGEDIPFGVFYKHAFKSTITGKWLIELCPSTIHTTGYPSDHCAVCARTKELYDANKKDEAREIQRKKYWISNVLVINDGADPSKNGQVFKFTYGRKVFDKIAGMLNPETDEAPVDIFDVQEGSNFNLIIKPVGGFSNYDSSRFSKQSKLGTDAEIAAILKQLHPLTIDPATVKTKAQIADRFRAVMTPTTAATDDADFAPQVAAAAPTHNSKQPVQPSLMATEFDDEFFQNLTNQNEGTN